MNLRVPYRLVQRGYRLHHRVANHGLLSLYGAIMAAERIALIGSRRSNGKLFNTCCYPSHRSQDCLSKCNKKRACFLTVVFVSLLTSLDFGKVIFHNETQPHPSQCQNYPCKRSGTCCYPSPQLLHLALWRTSWAVVSPPTTVIRLATSSIVWCLQRPQVMKSHGSGSHVSTDQIAD